MRRLSEREENCTKTIQDKVRRSPNLTVGDADGSEANAFGTCGLGFVARTDIGTISSRRPVHSLSRLSQEVGWV
jgi:hypothetical protein